MSRPHCIVCGRPIKKRMRTLSFLPAEANGRQNGERKDNYVYLDHDQRPKDKVEAQKYTNHEITRVTWHNGRIFSITWWDGDYEDEFFDTQKCAVRQGYASARRGDRYTWK